ncbi:unnamed protein product [Closterium sp. NIES-64]|nr:unnamed protein product [Closterium sp. NIES-64]CAI5972975.1 unnamed protein product [Closterium sp. NIES-65]
MSAGPLPRQQHQSGSDVPPRGSFWQIRRFRRLGFYTGIYIASACAAYTYANIAIRAHVPLVATPYSGYASGAEILVDTTKLYQRALGNVFEESDWGPLEFTILAKHYERQGQRAYAYHAVSNLGVGAQAERYAYHSSFLFVWNN